MVWEGSLENPKECWVHLWKKIHLNLDCPWTDRVKLGCFWIITRIRITKKTWNWESKTQIHILSVQGYDGEIPCQRRGSKACLGGKYHWDHSGQTWWMQHGLCLILLYWFHIQIWKRWNNWSNMPQSTMRLLQWQCYIWASNHLSKVKSFNLSTV